MLLSKRSLLAGAGATFIVRPAMSVLRVRNPLIYPGGLPGVNYKHVAFNGGNSTLKFSGIALPGQGSFLRLDSGTRATVFGSPTGTMFALGGPALANASTTSGVYFTVGSAKAPIGPGITLATICASTTTQSANAYFVSGDDAGDQGIGTATGQSTMNPLFWSGGAAFISLSNPGLLGGTAVNSVAFYAVSISAGGAYNAVLTNLTKGGWVTTTSGTCTAPTEPAGADHVGIANWPNGGSGNNGLKGNVFAAAVVRSFLSTGQLYEWAIAPWDFWYPPALQNILANSLPSSGGGANQRTLTGVGK